MFFGFQLRSYVRLYHAVPHAARCYLHCPSFILDPVNERDIIEKQTHKPAIIDIDGTSWSSRFGMLLCSNSVVIKVRGPGAVCMYIMMKRRGQNSHSCTMKERHPHAIIGPMYNMTCLCFRFDDFSHANASAHKPPTRVPIYDDISQDRTRLRGAFLRRRR